MYQSNLLSKARILCNEGKVKIINFTEKYVSATVQGYHNTYTVMIWFSDGRPTEAKCGCPWNVLRHSDKWCSHIRAVLCEIGRNIEKSPH